MSDKPCKCVVLNMSSSLSLATSDYSCIKCNYRVWECYSSDIAE